MDDMLTKELRAISMVLNIQVGKATLEWYAAIDQDESNS
jgi:hypothetical protein